MKIAVLGLGEAGRLFSAGFISAGQEVLAFDPAPVETPAGVQRFNSAGEAVAKADIVLSLVTARFAESVAAEVASSLKPEAVYVDLNSGSPSLKQAVETALGEKASQFSDGSVMGSVPANKEKAPIALSGAAADRAASLLNEAGGNAEAISTVVGDASSRKLLRSVFAKGLGALITEALDAAEHFGDRETMLKVIAEYVPDDSIVARLESGTKLHAVRRQHEVADSLAMLKEARSDWPVTAGALALHAKAANATREADLLARLKELPTAAIGDGGDRLGFADSSVKPIWHAPRLVGRALPVHVHAGDNLGVHAALKVAQPGDVLVVAGDGHSDRALLGELIANRAINRGILGFITDGAVRDRDDLEAMGFPVWASGQSPAGPYKHGPFRVNTDISIGGTVCHPGDYVVADTDGVCFISPADLEKAVRGGEEVLAEEARRMKGILEARNEG